MILQEQIPSLGIPKAIIKKKGPKKGVRNNPSGRKPLTQKDYDLMALCREKTFESLNTIYSIMINEDNQPSDRLKSAMYIIDRGHGKAIQTAEINGTIELREVVRRIIDPMVIDND